MKIRTLRDAMNEHLIAWKDQQTAESKKQELEIEMETMTVKIAKTIKERLDNISDCKIYSVLFTLSGYTPIIEVAAESFEIKYYVDSGAFKIQSTINMFLVEFENIKSEIDSILGKELLTNDDKAIDND